MKVTRDTPEQLILEDTPWFTGIAISVMFLFFTGIAITSVLAGDVGGLIALIGSALAALAFWAFVRRTMVIFDQGNGTVEIRQRWINGFKSDSHPLSAVVQAHVETRTTRQENRTSRTHRMAIEMSDGHDPEKLLPTDVYAGGKAAERCTHAVNGWLAQN